MSVDKLRAELLALPTEERAELADALLPNLREELDADADAAWLMELDRHPQAVGDVTANVVRLAIAWKISHMCQARPVTRTSISRSPRWPGFFNSCSRAWRPSARRRSARPCRDKTSRP